MPRQPRLDAPDSYHHVMFRGLPGLPLFDDGTDHQAFLERLAAAAADNDLVVLAWALLPTHVHLLVRTGQGPLSRVMHRTALGYARDYNQRRNRAGHVFGNRYKSILVDEDNYLLELVRYVHLNPLRAGLVADLDALASYPWCGHGALLGADAQPFHDVGLTLGWFGPDREQARVRLLEHMVEGLEDGSVERLATQIEPRVGRRPQQPDDGEASDAATDTRVLGSKGFAATRLMRATRLDAERSRRRASGWTPEATVAWVCAMADVPVADVRAGRRHAPLSRARAMAAHLCADEMGYTLTETAAALGVSPSSISRALIRGREAWRDTGWELPGHPPGVDA